MTAAGAKIIEGLKDAVAGNFSAVTIEGQRWVRAPEWLPIDTAPKDGTVLLLFWPPIPFAKRKWGTARLGAWNGKLWAMEMPGLFRTDCTHWMPIPEPPVSA